MSSSPDDWDDVPAPLPIIRREPEPARSTSLPAPAIEEEDEDFDLWQDDEPAAEEWSAEPLPQATEEPWGEPGSEEADLPDPEALLRQMQGYEAEDDLPDPGALLRQMQGYEEDDLPDPEALLRQMQGYEEEDDLPDPEALLLQMQGYEEEDDLPDPEALLLQMQGEDQDDLPEPDALLLHMLVYEEEDDQHAQEALLRQMQGYEEEDDLPDPEALLLQMQGYEEENDLPDPEALLLQMQGYEEDDLPDPDRLILEMRGYEQEDEPVEDESMTLLLDEISDPGLLLLRRPSPDEPALPLDFEIPDPYAVSPSALDEASDEELSLLFVEPLEPLSQIHERDEELLPELQLELPPVSEPEPRLSRPSQVVSPSAGGVSDEDWDEVFLERSPSSSSVELPDPLNLLAPRRAQERLLSIDEVDLSGEDELPDPSALFARMQGQIDADELEPVSQASPSVEEEAAGPLMDDGPVEEGGGGLFSRIKARFTREKRNEDVDLEVTAAPLPDPVALFRQMQDQREPAAFVQAEFEAAGAAPEATGADFGFPEEEEWGDAAEPESPRELPALPDLDAFRAELEEEERSRLDSDLLGDLSGPERFAETVSDMEFSSKSFFAAAPAPVLPPVIARPEPPPSPPPSASAPSPTLPGRAGGWAPPEPAEDSEPLPAMLAQPGPTSRPPSPPPSAPRPPAANERPAPYQPAPRPPARKKGSSTAIMPGGAETKKIEPRPGLKERIQRFKERRRALTRHQLSIFTRQAAAMLKAGIPLHQVVSFCAEADPEAAPMLEDVCQKIETGYSLSGALKDYPESFDPVYVGLVHAGELSGRLNEMLAKLADILERELELRKRMISVITYPAMLLGVSILGTLGFIFFVLPQLTPLFMDLGVDLPWPTRLLLNLRTILLPASVTTVLAALVFWFSRRHVAAYIQANPSLERRLAYAPLALPVVGPVYDKIVTARVLYSMATMLEVGVTMNQALARAEGAAGNAYVAYRLSRARADLAEGSSVTECFQINSVFPETALHLISAGEESARLVEMFNYVARHFDEDVQQAMDAAAGMLEPLIMVLMGAVVGFIVIAAALPTIHLLQNFG